MMMIVIINKWRERKANFYIEDLLGNHKGARKVIE